MVAAAAQMDEEEGMRKDWTARERAMPAVATVASDAARRHARRATRLAYLSIALALVSITLSIIALLSEI